MAKAIQVQNVSKQYRLGQIGTGSLVHDLNRWWHSIRGREDPYLQIGETNDRTRKGNSDYVWSLRNLNFQIEQGDTVGIIGRNGAGKSTLLKILSRVTAPTTGDVKVKGRIASLLEVGTGFHPELSGRDNIFLNGAILGMRKHEIKRKFDEIVDFAGVERYIDTPVKRYSSGMYVRLAFGVAAHLESEILIVDEVLAVGDAEFQKKALGKMQSISKGEGRTVLFVSHSMSSIKNLCSSGMILTHGELTLQSGIDNVINAYINDQHNKSMQKIDLIERNNGNGLLRFTDLKFYGQNGSLKNEFSIGEEMRIEVEYKVKPEFFGLKTSRIDIGINNLMGERVTWLSSVMYTDKIENIGKMLFIVDRLLLNKGTYNINLFCETNSGVADWVQNVSHITIHDNDFFGTGRTIPEGQGNLITEFYIQ
ncbi:MAG: ABC transporter ATP-binding protein [Sphingobacteriales bacterium]|nr:MAG: ABC transporter ATP-binding protein [Sphingobacteriales bacterium]